MNQNSMSPIDQKEENKVSSLFQQGHTNSLKIYHPTSHSTDTQTLICGVTITAGLHVSRPLWSGIRLAAILEGSGQKEP